MLIQHKDVLAVHQPLEIPNQKKMFKASGSELQPTPLKYDRNSKARAEHAGFCVQQNAPLVYSKRWSVRNRVPGIARLDFLRIAQNFLRGAARRKGNLDETAQLLISPKKSARRSPANF